MRRSSIKLIICIILIITVAGCNTLSEEEKEKFREAIKNDDRRYIEYILSKGVNLNNEKVFGYVPLHIAARFNNIELIELFLKHGADINCVNEWMQNCLFFTYDVDTIKYLIEHGANVNQVNVNGFTPLLGAARNYEVAKLYIEMGADYNHQDRNGNSILFFAIMYKNFELIKYLIDAKVVNVNNVNELGLNALILHIMCGSKGKYKNTSIYKKIIIYLIKGGININHQDNDGNTALHIAIKVRQNNEIIKLLLDNGADVNIKNKNGKTPLDIAMEKGDKDIINLLKMYAKK